MPHGHQAGGMLRETLKLPAPARDTPERPAPEAKGVIGCVARGGAAMGAKTNSEIVPTLPPGWGGHGEGEQWQQPLLLPVFPGGTPP